MPGAMRKLGLYLGLVEDEEDGRDRRYADDYGYDDEDDDFEPAAPPVRRWTADEGAPSTARTVAARRPHVESTRGSVALDTSLRTAPAPVAHEDGYRITTLHPRTYNEAR